MDYSVFGLVGCVCWVVWGLGRVLIGIIDLSACYGIIQILINNQL